MTVKVMNTCSLSVPPSVAHSELHRAIVALDSQCDRFEVLAGSLRFVTPLELCGLRALIDHAAQLADRVHFDDPLIPDVHNYLARMDFYSDLPPNVELSRKPPTIRRNDRRDNLIELCRIMSIEDVEALPERVWRIAHPHFGTGPTAKACGTAIAAATENVLDHARSPIGALVAAQRYDRAGLELAVVDLGLGIPTTLRANAEFGRLTDLDAVEQAVRDGVTSTGEKGRGAGLAELISTAQRAGNSTLVIQSGYAHLTVSSRGGLANIHRTCPGTPVPGTWISLRLQP